MADMDGQPNLCSTGLRRMSRSENALVIASRTTCGKLPAETAMRLINQTLDVPYLTCIQSG